MEFCEQERLALTFSYMAYLGFGDAGTDKQNAKNILKDIKCALASWDITDGDWEVVWGPAVFALPGTVFDDAFLYMVRRVSDPNQHYLAIRGTNPVSVPNWVIWDFQAKEQIDWPFVAHDEDFHPRVSQSTNFGFNILYSIRPAVGMPGERQTVLEYIDRNFKGNPEATLCVTGHSLGGAMASTVGLWLTEVQSEHNYKDAEINVVSFAAPTAGNGDFAKHANKTLAGKCKRIANDLDVVTHAWNTQSMETLPMLYGNGPLPWIFPTPPTWLFLKHLTSKSIGKDYTQIDDAVILEGKKYCPQPHLLGVKYPLALLYLGQAIYQHVWAYPELMGMQDDIPTDKLFSVGIVKEITQSLVHRHELPVI